MITILSWQLFSTCKNVNNFFKQCHIVSAFLCKLIIFFKTG